MPSLALWVQVGGINIMFKEFITKAYVAKRLIIFLLCIVHDFTKYKSCRSFADIFYWPEGFCADMVVIALFFLFAILCVLDDFKIMAKQIKRIGRIILSIYNNLEE